MVMVCSIRKTTAKQFKYCIECLHEVWLPWKDNKNVWATPIREFATPNYGAASLACALYKNYFYGAENIPICICNLNVSHNRDR